MKNIRLARIEKYALLGSGLIARAVFVALGLTIIAFLLVGGWLLAVDRMTGFFI